MSLAYCTGLLLARRVLKMLEMDDEYQGNVEVIGMYKKYLQFIKFRMHVISYKNYPYRQLGRISLLNRLRAEGPSVLSLMWGSSEQPLEIVFLVLSRYQGPLIKLNAKCKRF